MKKKIISSILAVSLALGAMIVPVTAEKNPLIPSNGSSVSVDTDKMTVSSVYGVPTVSELVRQFDNEGLTVTFDGNTLSEGDKVPAGAKIIFGGDSYTVAIAGDVNSDAKISSKDVSKMLRMLAGTEAFDETGAFDTNLDGNANARDVSNMIKFLAGLDATVGAKDTFYTEQFPKTENLDETLDLWFGDNLTKDDKYESESDGSTTDMMYLAKNEIEFTQVLIQSNSDRTGMSATVTEFVSPDGNAMRSDILFSIYYDMQDEKTLEKMTYPDALPPASKGFKLDAMGTMALVVKAFSTADTPSGMYRAKVSITQDGKEIRTAYVYAYVWDFALSDDTACATAFGLERYQVYSTHAQYDPDEGVLYSAYYDFLLENRICAYSMPFSVLDERADSYMSNPRVTSFMIDGRDNSEGDMTDEQLAEAYEKMKDNEEWMSKGYFYYVDEPTTKDQVYGKNGVEGSAKRLAEFFPDFRLTVPYFTEGYSGTYDMTELLDPYVNLWCPLSAYFTTYEDKKYGGVMRYNDDQIADYGTAEERFSAKVADGDELWWYVCIGPDNPYANFFAEFQGNQTRVLFWQQYMFNVDGLLYWSVNDWNMGEEWRKINSGFGHGDGRLIYAGNKYKIRGPISSIRLEMVRDGIEDYQYLTMIEEKYGREKAMEFVNQITTSICNYSKDADLMRSVRNEMGKLLEK